MKTVRLDPENRFQDLNTSNNIWTKPNDRTRRYQSAR